MTAGSEGVVPVTREWRCFHCDDVFTSEACARLHFGETEDSAPACQIKAGAEGSILRALRSAEQEANSARQAIADENTEAARAYYSQTTRHSQALIAAEELGYERGLSDGRALADQRDERGGEFQARVRPWLLACFGELIAGDREERNHRFLEEALELVQSLGCTASEAHQLVNYVYGRPIGEPAQEVGGVMVTLAALCLANGLNMHAAGETELARIWTKVEAIRAKQAAKPKHSPLPEATPTDTRGGESALREALVEAYTQGASDVHAHWVANPGEAPKGDPEFHESAIDYTNDALDPLSSAACCAALASPAAPGGVGDVHDLLTRLDDWAPGLTAVRKDCLEAAAVIRALLAARPPLSGDRT